MDASARIEPLAPSHNRAAFSCGAEPLDRYLRQQAGQDMRNWVAAVFVLRVPDSSAFMGYYTLSATAIEATALAPELRRKLPRYPNLSAVLLGRLAVDRRSGGQGWGKVLLLDALRRSLRFHEHIAAMAVVVDAKDDNARAFYEHYGFQRFLEHAYRLYLPMATIEQLFGSQSPTGAG